MKTIIAATALIILVASPISAMERHNRNGVSPFEVSGVIHSIVITPGGRAGSREDVCTISINNGFDPILEGPVPVRFRRWLFFPPDLCNGSGAWLGAFIRVKVLLSTLCNVGDTCPAPLPDDENMGPVFSLLGIDILEYRRGR